MSQIGYSRYLGSVFPGLELDAARTYKRTAMNNTGAEIAPGLAVAQDNTTPQDDGAVNLALATDECIGIVLNDFAHNPDPLTTTNGAYAAGVTFPMLVEGPGTVRIDGDVDPSKEVYVRFAASGTGKTGAIGSFRADSDAGTCRKVRGARWLKTVTLASGAAGQLWFSAAADSSLSHSQGSDANIQNASTSASLTIDFTTGPNRFFVVDGVDYTNETGLAVDTSNYFALAVKNGATTLASASTHDTAVVASTPLALALNGTPANLIVPPGTKLQFVMTKTGTQTLPAGTLTVHGHYV